MATKNKSFTHFISSTSWIFSIISLFPSLILVLSPSLAELLVVCVVDAFAGFLLNLVYFPIFRIRHPKSELFFYGIDEGNFAQLNKQDRVELLTCMIKFPSIYAMNSYWASFIKAIPAFLIIVLYWKHPATSNFVQLLLIMAICGLSWVYFYGCSFYDAHAKIAQWIAELHQKFNLSEEFDALQLPERPDSLQMQEILVQVFIIVFVLALQFVVIFGSETQDQLHQNHWNLAIKLVVIGVVGLALFTRIWYMGRKNLVGGLLHIFEQMHAVDINSQQISLPLHSTPLLATFEKTFNSLTKRISVSERQLRNLVFQEAEKSRYQVLGEISGLIAHDLSAPLHVTQYCLNEIKERPLNEEAKKYVEQMGVNVMQAIGLISSLRARLKDTPEGESSAEFMKTHDHVVRILSTQFSLTTVQKINFDLDPQLAPLKIAISQMDLIQILENLYRNSLRNLIDNAIANPMIRVSLRNLSECKAEIVIADNGTGLTLAKFEELTNENKSVERGFGRSLGLRLTRRLIEQRGGQLSLLQVDKDRAEDLKDGSNSNLKNKGTHFCLTLKLDNKQTA